MAIIVKPQSQEPRQRLALVSAVSMLWAESKPVQFCPVISMLCSIVGFFLIHE